MNTFETVRMSWDGSERRFRLWRSLRATRPRPLLIVLAGGDQSGRQVAAQFDLRPGADGFARPPYVVVVPESLVGDAGFRCWNSGNFPGAPFDDVGFIAAAVRTVRADLGDFVSPDTFVVGFSNGGMMAYRLAAEWPEAVTAIGVVGAVSGGTRLDLGDVVHGPASHGTATSVMHIHALDDRAILAAGGVSRLRDRIDLSVFESVRPWIDGLACDRVPQFAPASSAPGTSMTWTGRDDAQVVLELIGGGHSVPAGAWPTFDAFFRRAGRVRAKAASAAPLDGSSEST